MTLQSPSQESPDVDERTKGPPLDEVAALIRRHVVMRPEEHDAVALWVAHTWAIDAAHFTPYLSITSAVSESGKSTLLRVLEHLVHRPWKTGRVTAAVLVRRIDREQPTLLLDETDAAFASGRTYSETLRGILNDGFARGGVYSTVAGQDVRDYQVFGPKALAGIGKLPDTIASRSIHIRLRRRKPEDQVTPIDPWELDDFASTLRAQLERWASKNVSALKLADTQLPTGISDRARDAWTPLAAIATVTGGDWPARAERAAGKLSDRTRSRSDRDETRVLTVIREAFDDAGADRLLTSALAKALTDAGLVAPEKALTAEAAGHALKQLLQPFEVGPSQKMRLGLKTGRGYGRTQFEDAWERYL